jgi:hypothetical protein
LLASRIEYFPFLGCSETEKPVAKKYYCRLAIVNGACGVGLLLIHAGSSGRLDLWCPLSRALLSRCALIDRRDAALKAHNKRSRELEPAPVCNGRFKKIAR